MTHGMRHLLAIALAILAGCGPDRPPPEEEAAWLLAGLDLESRAAQLLIPPLRTIPDSMGVAAQERAAAAGRLSGVWIDDGDARETATAIARLRAGSRIPLLVAAPIDGGLPLEGATRFPAAATVAALASPEDARVAGAVSAHEARAVGIDLGFVAAPPTNDEGPLAYAARAPERTAAGLRALVEGAGATGLSVGVVGLWSEGVADPYLAWDRARLEAIELPVLSHVVDAGVDALAFGAIRLPAVTGDSTPLPLAPAAIRGLARRDLGFEGLVVADLAPTSPVVSRLGAAEAAVRALDAGVDLLVRVEDPQATAAAIAAAVRDGRLSRRSLEAAALRVLTLKARASRVAAPVHPDSLARALAAPAATRLAARLDTIAAAPVLPAPAPVLDIAQTAAAMDSLAGIDSARLARVDSILRDAMADSVFTAAAIAVGRRGALVRLAGYGPADPAGTLFDIASLTKVVGTTTAAAILVDRGEMSLDAPVRRYVPEWRGAHKSDVTIAHLLTHTSGLPSGLWLFGSARSPEQALRQTLEQDLRGPPGEDVEYSDLGMILLAHAVERAAGMPIDRFLALHLFAPLGMQRTMFLPPLALRHETVATAERTERDFPLRGIVHDANAFRLGGVTGHAGLFSTAADLAVFAQAMLNGGAYGSATVLTPPTIDAFTRRRPNAGTRALGWDTPSDRSSAGRLLSARAYGHTGYTGTSIWIDPQLEMFVILLTNRTYAGASAAEILRLRATVHYYVAAAVSDTTVQPRPGSRPVR